MSICSIASSRPRSARDRGFERVEIDGYDDDLGNRILLRLRNVIAVLALVENGAEYLGMQRFDAAAEKRGKTGEVLDVARRNAVFIEKRLRAAGRVDFDPSRVQRAR